MDWGKITRYKALKYFIAILIIGVAIALRAALFADPGRGIPYLTYYPAVMLAALIGGLYGGLLATVLHRW